MPHGDCPSLKFHCRSDSWVLLISTGVVDEKVVLEETELLGTKASVFEASTRTERSAKSTIVENLETAIVAVYKLNVYEARLIQIGLLILLLFLKLAVQSKEKLSGSSLCWNRYQNCVTSARWCKRLCGRFCDSCYVVSEEKRHKPKVWAILGVNFIP